MTPHINAENGAFAKTVLMPGDPLRARYIATTYLKNVREVSNIRNMLGFTGTWQGQPVSVMGHGMGIPSCAIYSKELITDYAVENLIRVGSCGAVGDDINLRDVLICLGAATDSKVNRSRFMGHDFAATADFSIVSALVKAAESQKTPVRVGNFFSTDLFYSVETEIFQVLRKYGILGIEMEAAGMFGVAAEFGAKAGAICTVSDHILRAEQTSAEERQSTFNAMMTIALDAAVSL